MKQLSFIALIIALFSIQSCEQDNFFDITTEYNTTPLQVKGAYKGPDEVDFIDFKIDIGVPENGVLDDYYYWNADVSQGALAPTLIVGAYISRPTFNPVNYFGLQFWSDQLPADRQWNKEELEAFFAAGNTFELGQGNGLVDVSFRYPGVDDFGSLDEISSKSSFLDNPLGQLVVTKTEGFKFEGIRLTEARGAVYDGLLVSCVVNAEVGLNRSTLNWGTTASLDTDEVIELREVEVTFFVGY